MLSLQAASILHASVACKMSITTLYEFTIWWFIYSIDGHLGCLQLWAICGMKTGLSKKKNIPGVTNGKLYAPLVHTLLGYLILNSGGLWALWASLVAQVGKNLPAVQEIWVWSLSLEDNPGEGNGYQIQYSCLENSMNRGAWRATVLGVANSQAGLSH